MLLIGAGDTSELVAQHLKQQGVVDNRGQPDVERANELAEKVGGRAHSLSELGELLPSADIVVARPPVRCQLSAKVLNRR